MSISFDVLGQPGRDNAALVRVDSGQAIHRLLFDCGDGCLSSLGYSEIMSIDHVCFSHFHMDHIAGLDQFLRCNYSRTEKPNHLWGPPNSVEILPHRFHGFWWNLTADSDAAWLIHGVDHNKIETVRLNSSKGFRIVHPEPEEELVGATFSTDDYAVHSMLLDHKGPSVAYKIVEPTSPDYSRGFGVWFVIDTWCALGSSARMLGADL